jgi:putative DNA primase/helicase
MSALLVANFPAELCALDQWLGYRIAERKGKLTKVPYSPNGDYEASSTDPKTWGPFETACAAVERFGYDGKGFVFSEVDPYAGIDFDNCVVDEVIDPTVLAWVHRFGSYAEISVSGTGVHVIIRGVMPEGKGRKSTKRGIEMYDRGRYFTVSDRHIEGTPTTVNDGQEALDALYAELFTKAKPSPASSAQQPSGDIPVDDQELLQLMFASRNGHKIRRLWDGDTNGHSKDHSSADLALCNFLAFWTGNDAARMDRMFRQSKLYRDKWDREDYRDRTINEAIADTTEVYKGTGPKLRMGQTTADSATLLSTASVHVGTNGNGYHADDQDSDSNIDSAEASYTWPYSVKNGRMMHTRIQKAKDGTETEIDTIIADFVATIVGEQIDELGSKVFVIEGHGLRCGHFRVEIPASDYGDTGKLIAQLESVSSRDPIHPEGRRHIGTAIKKLTDDNLWQERRFTRTGWADDNFLIRGREPKGIRIDLPRKLAYQIDPDANLDKGLQALTSLIRSPGAERGAIIVSHILLAPMAHQARLRNERSGIFIKGRSGTKKTTTAQTFMAVYGAGFLEDETLVRWGEGATRNAIMKQAASTDDMPFVIDNFKPGTGDGARGFVNLVHAMMEGGEKDRLNRSSELRESKPVLCWPIFTGEDIPDTDPASLARLLVVQFEDNGTVENQHLSNAQCFAYHLSAVGGAWLDWLESPEGKEQTRLAGEALPIRRDSWARWLRRSAPNMINPHRVATNLATNELAFEVALKHPAIGAVLAPFAEAHGRGLKAIAQGMGNYTAQSLEAARYLQALRELLTTGRAILQTNDLVVAEKYNARLGDDIERERLQDRVIGWSDGDGGAYLFPGTARQAVAKLLGDNLGGLSDSTLYDQLKGLGAIHSGNQKTTFQKRLGNGSSRVLHVLPSALEEDGDANL